MRGFSRRASMLRASRGGGEERSHGSHPGPPRTRRRARSSPRSARCGSRGVHGQRGRRPRRRRLRRRALQPARGHLGRQRASRRRRLRRLRSRAGRLTGHDHVRHSRCATVQDLPGDSASRRHRAGSDRREHAARAGDRARRPAGRCRWPRDPGPRRCDDPRPDLPELPGRGDPDREWPGHTRGGERLRQQRAGRAGLECHRRADRGRLGARHRRTGTGAGQPLLPARGELPRDDRRRAPKAGRGVPDRGPDRGQPLPRAVLRRLRDRRRQRGRGCGSWRREPDRGEPRRGCAGHGGQRVRRRPQPHPRKPDLLGGRGRDRPRLRRE